MAERTQKRAFIERTQSFENEHAAYLLTCPTCGSEYTHHGDVAVFQRPGGEDKPSYVVAPVGMTGAATAHNPSPRRDAVRIAFECENSECPRWHLDIIQHKGQTFILASSADKS